MLILKRYWQDLKGEARKTVELRILEYLRDNTEIGIPPSGSSDLDALPDAW